MWKEFNQSFGNYYLKFVDILINYDLLNFIFWTSIENLLLFKYLLSLQIKFLILKNRSKLHFF